MESQVHDFINYLQVEKGLAANTLESYGRDLRQFTAYLSKQEAASLPQVSRPVIVAYLASLQEKGRATSTICRTLAAIKSFFRFLVLEKTRLQ